LPADLGFYDLRVHQTMIDQANLARQYGIYGFCYYHYWFNGKRMLERPLEEMLSKRTPDFPFCLCWANENWTRRWDGRDEEVLLKQEYSEEDDKKHIELLAKYFSDPRYIRVDGKPLFIVYRPALFPDIKKTAERWRSECRENGTGEIYLAFMQSFGNFKEPAEIGFDAAIEFQPNFSALPKESKYGKGEDHVFLYKDVMKNMITRPKPPGKIFPGVFPMWDNAARRTNGATIIHDSSPEKYGEWLASVVKNFKPYSKDENFVFINAWNEWAEGNHLEPCRKWGLAYLEETKKALNK
jgi:lipopolysaccharide biosynthesis protein